MILLKAGEGEGWRMVMTYLALILLLEGNRVFKIEKDKKMALLFDYRYKSSFPVKVHTKVRIHFNSS